MDSRKTGRLIEALIRETHTDNLAWDNTEFDYYQSSSAFLEHHFIVERVNDEWALLIDGLKYAGSDRVLELFYAIRGQVERKKEAFKVEKAQDLLIVNAAKENRKRLLKLDALVPQSLAGKVKKR